MQFKYQVNQCMEWVAIDISNSGYDSNGLQCYCERCKTIHKPDQRYSVRLITAGFSHKCYKTIKCVLPVIIQETSVVTWQPFTRSISCIKSSIVSMAKSVYNQELKCTEQSMTNAVEKTMNTT